MTTKTKKDIQSLVQALQDAFTETDRKEKLYELTANELIKARATTGQKQVKSFNKIKLLLMDEYTYNDLYDVLFLTAIAITIAREYLEPAIETVIEPVVKNTKTSSL